MDSIGVLVHAVDLGAGSSFDHFPDDLVDDLLAGICQRRARWAGPTLVVAPDDRPSTSEISGEVGPDVTVLRGTAAQLCSLVAGRPAQRVTADAPPIPDLGPWL